MHDSQNIADALLRAKKVTQKRNANIVQSNEIKRADRELLLRTHWLQEIIKGWYMLTRPDTATNDSAAWYANFWDFLRVYLRERFGNKYCLSPESSLELYAEAPLIPKQVIVIVPKGGSNNYSLSHDTSLLIYADAKNFPTERNVLHGLQVFPLVMALCKTSSTYFKNDPKNAAITLRLINNPSEISKTIIKNNLKNAGNRLIGAYQFLGYNDFAQAIIDDLETGGFATKPENPFAKTRYKFLSLVHNRIRSPYAARIAVLWAELRDHVLATFSKPPGLPKSKKEYLAHIDEIYQYDAYNSLSIEGYKVTPDLIEKVKKNSWNPDINPHDKDVKNALAARGYYDAFQEVKKSVKKALNREKPADILNQDLQNWYRKLFLPNVQAGIISAEHLMGYRDDRVYIRNSRHVPPPKEAVMDAMETLFNCIKQEPSPAVRAVLGHYLFVFIHPYTDGNGRMARFLMNVMLASGGYPWTIIKNKNRQSYMRALKIADEKNNLKVFAEFILQEMTENVV